MHNFLSKIQLYLPIIRLVIIVSIFIMGAYFTSKYTSQQAQEGFESLGITGEQKRCPNILVQEGNKIYLYNSKVAKVPGVNPIEFNNLEDYTEFMEWLRGRGIRCPVLYLQYSYDAQGNPEYKFRPSPDDPQGGLSPNIPYTTSPAELVQIMDAEKDNPPYNQGTYPGYDPLNQNLGDYTAQDIAHVAKEYQKYSDNAMDTNWAGIRYSEARVNSGAYADRTRTNTSNPL